MSEFSLEKMSWLERAPVDFSEQLRATKKVDFISLQKFVMYGLDYTQLCLLAKRLRSARNSDNEGSSLKSIRLLLLSNANLSFNIAAIEATGLRYGINIECIETEYGQVAQTVYSNDCLDETIDCVLLFLDGSELPLSSSENDPEESVSLSIDYVLGLCKHIQSKTNANVLVHNLTNPCENLFGHLDNQVSSSLQAKVQEFNHKLVQNLTGSGNLIFDLNTLAGQVGTGNWFEPKLYHMAKLPFAQKFIPLYADHVCRILAARAGLSKRVLVLDLDNTIWGGVIGDDGMDGIVLGNGSPVGEAFLDVQRTALRLRERGIVLAVCSKNEEETAREPFRSHPDMLLREEHIAVFVANWNNKADNLRLIADTLSLGTETLAFLDDNPVERSQVRQELPEVGVCELPKDPSLYSCTLLASGYFETVSFSQEDRKRADYYHGNAKRIQLQNNVGNLEQFLISLNMEAEISPFDSTNRERVTQLVNKTNQFNLTTRRHDSQTISLMQSDETYETLQVRLKDQFGDNGLVSVVILKSVAGGVWVIDTWLMSCRVLGRRLEDAIMNEIAERAEKKNIREIIGVYIPTKRNGLVKGMYEKFGFTGIDVSEENESECWRLQLGDWRRIENIPIKIKSVNSTDLAA